MQLFYFAIDIATVACAALLGLGVLAAQPRLVSARLIALLCFNLVCAVLLGRDDYSYWIAAPYRLDVGAWAPLMNVARNATPALFMVLCHTLFTDGRRAPRWLFALAALQLFLEEPVQWFWRPTGAPGLWITETLPTLLQTFFVGVALYWTLAGWRGDLVEQRRRVRLVTFFIIGADTIATGLLTRVLISPDNPANFISHQALVASHGLIAAFLLVQLAGGDSGRLFDPVHAKAPPPAPANPDAGFAAKLAALMQTERLYLQPGLTLKELADAVGLPEYRLRKLIHETLGFANFNAFLHSYRIADASGRLRDPAEARTPILTIALSVGYQSVNTFNRGFRDIMGVTPSAYRAAQGENPPPKPE